MIIWFCSYLLILQLSTIYGTEWPIMCWCAVKKLLTHWPDRLSDVLFAGPPMSWWSQLQLCASNSLTMRGWQKRRNRLKWPAKNWWWNWRKSSEHSVVSHYRQHCAQRKEPIYKLLRWQFSGATRCTDGSEIWHEGVDRNPCQISPPSVQR